MTHRSIRYNVVVPYNGDRPVLPVTVSYGGKTTPPLEGLVDSGADRSVFPVVIALYLGIDLSTCGTIEVGGVIGKDDFYECAVVLRVQGRDINARVWFNPSGSNILLGRADVFNRFRFGFLQQSKELLILRY